MARAMKAKPTRSRERRVEPAPRADAGTAAPAQQTLPVWHAASIVAITTLVVASVIVRLQNLVSPLLEAHAFRQTQTAFTVWGFLREGVSWFHAQLPVYGPPWEVPFEFPLFQATAALVARVTRLDVDPACRLTNLLFFYASAGVLYLICRNVSARCATNREGEAPAEPSVLRERRLGSSLPLPNAFTCNGRGPAVAVVVVYLWSPFTILWSRASMIEYAAVTFALAYVYAMLCWLEGGRRRLRLVAIAIAAIVLGCLGALVKITTMAITVPVLVAFIWDRFRRKPDDSGDSGDSGASRRGRGGWLACVALMLGVPVAVGQLWVMHTDHVKAASPVTSWLTSDALRLWNYGTFGQRLLADDWATIIVRIGTLVLPYGAAALPLVAFAFWRKYSRAERLLLGSMLAGALFPIVLFFNLYAVHDYYLSAITPCLAIVAGYGLHGCFTRLPHRAATGTLTTIVLLASLWGAKDYLIPAYVVTYDAPICQFGLMIRTVTPPERHVLVADTGDWDPTILYYARRKGLMYYQQRGLTPVDPDATIAPAFLQSGGYATLACREAHPAFAAIWPARRKVGQLGELQLIKLDASRAGLLPGP
jgi:hypothetical protein